MEVITKCKQCGKPLDGKWKKKYCSNACSTKNNNDKTKEKALIVRGKRKCKVCDAPLWGQHQKQFCSGSCSTKYNNGLRPSKKKICLNCEKEFTSRHSKYCSRECYLDKEEKKSIENFYRGTLKCKTHRKVLLKIRGHKCEKCGIDKWMGDDIRLEVHHKDGKSKNNSLDNLVILCPNCHSQTNNYGSKNKACDGTQRKEWRNRNRQVLHAHAPRLGD